MISYMLRILINAINNNIDEFVKEVEDAKVEEDKENELSCAKKRGIKREIRYCHQDCSQ